MSSEFNYDFQNRDAAPNGTRLFLLYGGAALRLAYRAHVLYVKVYQSQNKYRT